MILLIFYLTLRYVHAESYALLLFIYHL